MPTKSKPRTPKGRLTTPSHLTAVDLFAGCGGLTTGLKAAGYRLVAAVELDNGAADAYEMNHSDLRVFREDIRRLSSDAIRAEIGGRQLDLLAGCPPCQGFSRLRTLNGTTVADERNELIFEYLRLVKELRPRALLFENVPGILMDERYVRLCSELRALGYLVNHAVHDAADFGVPQRRKRLIMVAASHTLVGMPSPSGEMPRTVRATIGRLGRPGTTGDPAHDVSESRTKAVRDLIKRIPPDGGSRKDLDEQYTLDCHRRCDGFYDVYGRMRWDDVSPTITSGFVNPSKGRFLHPSQHRCITPREAALLQTFPLDYKFPMSLGKYPVARMIGNAFPPELARRHALAVAAALQASGG